MSINETLFDEIQSVLYEYGCDYEEIHDFLLHRLDFLPRQQKAIMIIKGIMTMHGKQELQHHVSELARIEHGIRELEPWVRDHVVHALLCFLLGIKINESFFAPNNLNKVTYFQWKLAGLFHDIGYPMQIAKDIISPFTNQVNKIKRDIGIITPDIQFRVVPIGLDHLQNSQNSFSLIQECLNQWHIGINAEDEYKQMIEEANICHGMISALTVLYVIDLMYQRYNPSREYQDTYLSNTNINWNQKNFEQEVIPACSAIFLHNLPSTRFQNTKIDPSVAPLPFLLKLTDTLQEWERPSLNNIHGYSSDDFDMEFNNTNFTFHVNDPKARNKIQEEINLTLISTNVTIV